MGDLAQSVWSISKIGVVNIDAAYRAKYHHYPASIVNSIYRRYLAGEDSVVLARAFGLGDRRIRDIIERERKRG